MKFNIPTTDLKSALDRLSVIPGAAGAVIYTQAVRFSTDEGKLKLTRFTSEAKIVITCESAEVIDIGAGFCVDHSALSLLVSRIPGKQVSLKSDEKHVHFESGKYKGKLAVYSEEAEADAPESEMETESIKLPIDDLSAALSFVMPAMGVDKARIVLCGVCIRMMGGKLCFIGTNGRQCHIVRMDYEIPVDCVLPSEGAQAIMKAIAKDNGACTLSIGENKIAVTGATSEISVSMMEDKLPNIEPMVNGWEANFISKITVAKEELKEALYACGIIGETDSKIARWTVAKNGLKIEASNLRDSDNSMAVDCAATAEIRIGVPSSQLSSAIEGMKTDESGNLEILCSMTNVAIFQPDRIVSISLAKLPEK